jgi:acyl-CoA thioesterase-1
MAAVKQAGKASIPLRLLIGCMLWLSLQPLSAATILVMGDSLSAAHNIPRQQGWVNLLQQRLQESCPQWQVVNASISGETSSGGRSRLPQLLQQHEPDVVLLALGANDGLRALPVAQLEDNLDAMIKLSRDDGASVLLLGIQVPDNYGPVYQQRFAAVYQRLAERHELSWLPFFLDGVATREELMQDDGLHPTAAAQGLILDNVWPLVKPWLVEAGASDDEP